MSRTVTVGLDGSRESLAAADWAAREALLRELPLRLVHVGEPPSRLRPLRGDSEVQRHWPERMVDEAAADLSARHPGLEVATDRLAGRPADVLADDAATAELLVLGSRGLGGLVGFLVGSVALATVARAPCPTVLVRADSGDRAAAPTDAGGAEDAGTAPAQEVVLGVDLDRPSEELVAFAFDTAARHGAVLHVVHGWDMPPIYGVNPIALDPGLPDDLAEEKSLALEDALRPWREKHPAVELRQEAVIGRPARHLLEAAAGAFLVVVGRRVRRVPVGWHIGPVAHALMHHCAAPVAVVPHA